MIKEIKVSKKFSLVGEYELQYLISIKINDIIKELEKTLGEKIAKITDRFNSVGKSILIEETKISLIYKYEKLKDIEEPIEEKPKKKKNLKVIFLDENYIEEEISPVSKKKAVKTEKEIKSKVSSKKKAVKTEKEIKSKVSSKKKAVKKKTLQKGTIKKKKTLKK